MKFQKFNISFLNNLRPRNKQKHERFSLKKVLLKDSCTSLKTRETIRPD